MSGPMNRSPDFPDDNLPDEILQELALRDSSQANTSAGAAQSWSVPGAPPPPGSAPIPTLPRPVPPPSTVAAPPWLVPRPVHPHQAAEEALLVECPLCHAMVPRVVAKAPPVAAVLVALAIVGSMVPLALGSGAAWMRMLSSHMEVVIGALIALMGVLRKVSGGRSQGGALPEECPRCGGPLRTAVLAGWGEPSWTDDPYMQPRWMPRD
jgi:hypothetical protein